MFYAPDKYKKECVNLNDIYYQLQGTLEDKEAKITLARFLRQNLGLTTYLLTGIQLAPYQELTLKGFFNRNFSMCVWGRGCAKSFISSVYCILQCLFEPNTNILIAGPTFRTSRFIFEKIEQIASSPNAQLLAQCFTQKSIRRNDLFEWKINGGSIKAIPLNGEKIRGFRANILILDEFLLLPEEIVKTVLMPFLVAPQNISERIKIRKLEDALIKKGKMKESERRKFTSNVKMIALSSASFTFENLYKVYSDWVHKIYKDPKDTSKEEEEENELIKNSTYFVSQLSYKAIPEELIDKTIIDEAKSGGSDAIFQREYEAQFTDGSESYFSFKKMIECTFKLGESPHAKLIGDSDKKYILSIDPSFSNSPTSDFFAMSVFELNEENKTGTLVHSYAKAGTDLKFHIEYFYYLIKSFNIVMILSDNADGNFIQSANESKTFKDNHIKYEFVEFESELEGQEYERELQKAKKDYNLEGRKICFKQVFTQNFIRRSNELLQTNIDRKRIFFASNINGNEVAFEKETQADINLTTIGEEFLSEIIDNVDSNIYGTKKECSLIEVKTNPQGNQTFDLPLNLKKNKSPNRARKDRYTALLLGNWAIKCYYEIMGFQAQKQVFDFEPFMIDQAK